jgi:diguanylate cyclase (GGDEF)-like protein/PAS domain S-box-containing protein
MDEKYNLDPTSFYKGIIDNLFDGVYFVDQDRNITYWNKGAERITGYPADEVMGLSCRDNVLNHVTEEGFPLCNNGCPLSACMNDGLPREADVFLHHADGHRVPVLVRASPMYDKDGKIIGAVETFSADTGLSTIRKELRELRQSSQLDNLTGIANRHALDARLHGIIAEQKEQKEPSFGIMFIDIDDFKKVNDTYGHDAGDKVLQMVAQTIQKNFRRSDVVGRWGGEEFLAILVQVNSTKSILKIAEKIRMLIEHSRLDIDNHHISVTVSIGAVLLSDEDTIETVINRADQLMYQSKTNGKNRVTIE